MLTAPEIPRMRDGEGVCLCHQCQRWVQFRGGIVEMLIMDLARGLESYYRRSRAASGTSAGTAETGTGSGQSPQARPEGDAR